jgi:hypothetical protein
VEPLCGGERRRSAAGRQGPIQCFRAAWKTPRT